MCVRACVARAIPLLLSARLTEASLCAHCVPWLAAVTQPQSSASGYTALGAGAALHEHREVRTLAHLQNTQVSSVFRLSSSRSAITLGAPAPLFAVGRGGRVVPAAGGRQRRRRPSPTALNNTSHSAQREAPSVRNAGHTAAGARGRSGRRTAHTPADRRPKAAPQQEEEKGPRLVTVRVVAQSRACCLPLRLGRCLEADRSAAASDNDR